MFLIMALYSLLMTHMQIEIIGSHLEKSFGNVKTEKVLMRHNLFIVKTGEGRDGQRLSVTIFVQLPNFPSTQ